MYKLILLLLMYLLTPQALNAQHKNEYEKIINHIYSYNLTAAQSSLDSIKLNSVFYKKSPEFYLCSALIDWWYLIGDLTNENNNFESNLSKMIKEVEENNHLERFNKKFVLGALYGYLGRYHTFFGNWFSAYRYGSKGKELLEELLVENPEYYDAYLGLGIYHYYADYVPSIIKFFDFLFDLGGNRELGLKEVKVSLENGIYSKSEAKFSLAWIYLEMEKSYNESTKLLLELSIIFPKNPIVLSFLGKSYRLSKQYKKAIEIYKKIEKNYLSINFVSNNHKARFFSDMAYVYLLDSTYNTAISYFEKSIRLGSQKLLSTEPWHYYNLATSYYRVGDKAQALLFYKKVMQGDDYFGFHDSAEEKIKEISLEL